MNDGVKLGATALLVTGGIASAIYIFSPRPHAPAPAAPTARPTEAQTATAEPAPIATARPTGPQGIDDCEDVSCALRFAHFADSTNGLDPGAAQFAGWAAGKPNRLHWSDVAVNPDETTFGKVMKDSEAERGKRACFSGQVFEIKVDRSAGPAVYVGGLHRGSSIVRFIAIGDTGSIERNTAGRVCGYVTGTMSYENSRGGESHGVHVVGMFDLPANRGATPNVSAPRAAPAGSQNLPSRLAAQELRTSVGSSKPAASASATPKP